jgi:hypothetical protein
MKSPIIVVATAELVPGKDDAFNRWYNEKHVPDLWTCPGFLSVRRYECTADVLAPESGIPEPRFLAIFELQSEDALTTPELDAVKGYGPMTQYVRSTSSRIYRKTFESHAPSAR